jgi:hypothetical protein
MSDRLALANAIEDAGIERGAQTTTDTPMETATPTAKGQQRHPAAEPLFVTGICSSYRAREGEAA